MIKSSTDFIQRIKNMLHNGIVKVVFTKVDGTERTMYCTLRTTVLAENDALPKGVLNKDGSKKRVSEECIRAFDTEKKEWRSFRIDSVKSCVPVSLL